MTSPVLGVLVFLFSLAEAPALRIKFSSVFAQDEQNKLTPNRNLIFLGPLFFRTIIGLVLAVGMANLLSPDLKQRTFSN